MVGIHGRYSFERSPREPPLWRTDFSRTWNVTCRLCWSTVFWRCPRCSTWPRLSRAWS